MKNLVENQKLEDHVNANELEELQGGCGTLGCYGNSCDAQYGDEDDNGNVVF